MEKVIIKIIQNDPEGTNVDYKWQFYELAKEEGKSEFIKDVVAFANCLEEGDKYIIFGVKEKNGYPEKFQNITLKNDDSQLQEIIQSYIEPKIRFEIKKILYNGYLLAYIRIYNNRNRPYLFKKRILKFEEGDGIIRNGTKTNRITRSDYDHIYLNKNKIKDRKKDLKIEFVTGYSNDEQIKILGLRCIDVSIENRSNQSIELEYEMKIFKSDCITYFNEDFIRRKINEISQNKSFFKSLSIIPSRFEYSYNETNDLISLSRSINPKIFLSQKEKFEFIFGKYLFFDLNEGTCKIKGEIIFRSDDFTEGPLIKKFNISIPPPLGLET